ncbi:MAG: hypothetical protein VZR00_04135 [Lachnospiraceae bacterium]|nr:hypothetical protein [Lachnospiraceae bacterium]MEE3461068.1 hypothetical protein [Lachnospiraceae bacterium]
MARKVLDDEGKLSSNSDIYDKKYQNQSHRDEMNSLTPAQKFQYFKDYYLKYVIIAAIVLVVALVAIKDIRTARNVAINIAVVDNAFNVNSIDNLQKDLRKKFKIPDDQSIRIDTDYNSKDYNAVNRLQTFIYGGTVDIVIAPEEFYKVFATNGYMKNDTDYEDVEFYKDIAEEYRYRTKYTYDEDTSKLLKQEKKESEEKAKQETSERSSDKDLSADTSSEKSSDKDSSADSSSERSSDKDLSADTSSEKSSDKDSSAGSSSEKVTTDTHGDYDPNKEYYCGIFLNNAKYEKYAGKTKDRPIGGISINTKHSALASQVLQYLAGK